LKSAATVAFLAAALVAGSATSARADDDDDDDGAHSKTAHTGQVGLSAQIGTGYRVLFPYNEEYCGKTNDEGRASVCTGRSPMFLDLGLSYGLNYKVELLASLRLGLERDFGEAGVDGPRARGFSAGVRIFVESDGVLKFFSTIEGVVDTTDYSRTTIGGNGSGVSDGTDFGLRNVNALELDLHRTFGVYAHFGETVTFVNWLRFELQAGIGAQVRFP
jgi:hypothetical protein